jgi:gluconate 2-dehydrogenase gamma chain
VDSEFSHKAEQRRTAPAVDPSGEARLMPRRQFLAVSAALFGGVVLYSPEQGLFCAAAQDQVLHVPLRFFDSTQALIVGAAVSRIFPSDESGPGAKEAGVVMYIDRHLAGPYGSDRHRYTHGPFETGPVELGYQGKATPKEIYTEGLKSLSGFDRLEIAQQDQALEEIESSLFFSLLRQHTIEGMFCDPVHGGNTAMVGWQLIGFPGARMSNYDDVEKHFGQAFRPTPVSLGNRPSESEE